MKILVLSESFIIRDSLNHLLNETLNTNDIITSSNANHLSNEDLLEVDLSFIDINKNNINIVERLSKIRRQFKSLKIMILDSKKDIALFIKSVDYGIDGYILNIDDKDVTERLMKYSDEVISLYSGVNTKYKELTIKNEELSSIINLSSNGMAVISNNPPE